MDNYQQAIWRMKSFESFRSRSRPQSITIRKLPSARPVLVHRCSTGNSTLAVFLKCWNICLILVWKNVMLWGQETADEYEEGHQYCRYCRCKEGSLGGLNVGPQLVISSGEMHVCFMWPINCRIWKGVTFCQPPGEAWDGGSKRRAHPSRLKISTL